MKKIIIPLIVVAAVIWIGAQYWQKPTEEVVEQNKYVPETEITHGHGLAVDRADANKLYIATHHGLMVLLNEKDLFRVGTKEDDYMGFSAHPTQANVFFASGHPATGGNIGVQRSDDGGFTWTKLSDGVDGPVDFHAYAISPLNPDLQFGWYQSNVQRSIDGGDTWEIVSRGLNIHQLVADPVDQAIVYAATPTGIMKSADQGKTWASYAIKIAKDEIVSMAFEPKKSNVLFIFSIQQGFLKTSDGGKTWQSAGELGEEAVLHIAFSPHDSNVIYALSGERDLYVTKDGAATWNQIR